MPHIMTFEEIQRAADETRRALNLAPTVQPHAPRVEPPEVEHTRLTEELFQLQFRAEDSERVERHHAQTVTEVEAELRAKTEAVERLRKLNAPQESIDRLVTELTELQRELAAARRVHEQKVRIRASARKALKDWPHRERLGQLNELLKELRA